MLMFFLLVALGPLTSYVKADKFEQAAVLLRAEAETMVYSDSTQVTLSIATKEQTLSASIKRNDNLRQKIIRELVANGHTLPEITYTELAVSGDDRLGKKSNEPLVVNYMSISVNGFKTLQTLVEMVESLDEVMFKGNTMVDNQLQENRLALTTKVLDALMNQKLLYEQNLGIKLKPVSIREVPTQSNTATQPFVYRLMLEAAYELSE